MAEVERPPTNRQQAYLPLADQETVTCVIPGHHQQGREVVADELAVGAGPLEFELTDKCGYESSFACSSEDA